MPLRSNLPVEGELDTLQIRFKFCALDIFPYNGGEFCGGIFNDGRDFLNQVLNSFHFLPERLNICRGGSRPAGGFCGCDRLFSLGVGSGLYAGQAFNFPGKACSFRFPLGCRLGQAVHFVV